MPPVKLFHLSEANEIAVICNHLDGEATAIQILAPMLKSLDNSEQLLIMNFIVLLGVYHLATIISHWVPLTRFCEEL